ncbi:MAG: CHAD domain-containing protein [Hyphomicrobiaceae bacterium]
MAYRFKIGESFNAGLQRVGREQILRALAQYAEDDPAIGIHETRRCLKRLRALLRLVRPGIGDACFASENRRFRDIARRLSGSRDRTVLIATLATLILHAKSEDKRLLVLLRDALAAQPSGDNAYRHDLIASVSGDLKDSLEAWKELRLEPNSFEPLGEGLGATYERCRRLFRKAYRDGEDADFHEWRKAVQQHWRHMRLLQRGWPAYFLARARQASELSSLLGVAQDLALLADHIAGAGGGVLKPRQRGRLLALVRHRQDEYKQAAEPCAVRLCAEGASGHVERAMLYWEAAPRIAKTMPAAVTKSPGDVENEQSEKEPGADELATPRTTSIPAWAGGPASRRGSARPTQGDAPAAGKKRK